MVFRRDNKGGDAFQRQISALRQQLGGATDEQGFDEEGNPVDDGAYITSGYSPDNQDQAESPYGGSGYPADYGYQNESLDEDYDLPAAVIPVADASMTIVSNDTTWKGELSSEGTMHIHGRYDGVIRARQDVFILEAAVVSAEVHARNVVIAGRYDGQVSCESRLEVLPTGRVQGAVRAPTLIVHEGAEINGSIQMTNLEMSRPAPASLVSRRASAGADSRS